MKKNLLFWMLLLPMALGIVSCTDVTDNPAPVVVDDKPFPYDTEIDPSVRPGDNFYEYALGKWLHSSDPSPSIWKQIEDRNNVLVDEMVTNSSAPLMEMLRRQADEVLLNDSRCYDVLSQRLQMLEQVTTGEELFEAFGALQNLGYSTLFRLIPMSFYCRECVNAFVTGGITEDMTAAFRKPNKSQLDSLVNVYCGYLAGFGFSPERIAQIEENAISIETMEMGAYVRSLETLHRPLKAKRRMPGMKRMVSEDENGDDDEYDDEEYSDKWLDVLDQMGISEDDIWEDRVVFCNEEIIDLLFLFAGAHDDPEALATFRDYMIYNVIAQDAPFVPSINPLVKRTDMLKRAIQYNKYYMYRLLTEYNGYDNIYKQQCQDIMESMRQLFIHRLESLDWMSDATRAEARQKAEALDFYIGYPDQWNDALTPQIDGDFLLASVTQLRQNAVEVTKSLQGTALKDVAWELWASTAGFTSDNAFFEYTANSLVILPPWIMKPRFDNDLSESTLYAVSVAFAHEFSHGFDNTGSYYDAIGDYREWWTPADRQAFREKQQALIALYNQLEDYPGQPVNGQKTLSENMSDYGGTVLTLELYKQRLTEQGFKGAQFDEQIKKFFLAYAQLWKNERERDLSELMRLHEVDSHTACHNRVNGVLRLLDDWYSLYDVKETDLLYVKPEDRVRIW
ncbi:MAG: hypothetical protein J5545_07285 [Bacteroidaceae bacterium]|nr:hypothetical protein [Bacteroidaceae bacterium]